MSKTYSVAAARAHLPDILNQVEAGEDVGLTRRGRLVAVMLSSDEYELLRGARARFGDAYESFLERHSLSDIGLEADEIDALRDKSPGRQARL